jgi:4-alpha-glucanotransferase
MDNTSNSPRHPRGETRRRLAGVTVPLFSLWTERSWGIGEIPDLVAFADWAITAGLRLVQILPLGEISGGETSPYSALSAFGIDPLYIALSDVPDLSAADLETVIGDKEHAEAFEAARRSRHVEYGVVRPLKQRALELAFARFEQEHLATTSERARAFASFVKDEADWLSDYALYRALKDAHEGAPWWSWYRPLRDRDANALAAARERHAKETRFYEYLQWVAHEQWSNARAALRSRGVELMGDLPFMVARDSADVWAQREEFRDDASVGAPPDAFNEEGQDWDLPPYDWKKMAPGGYAWLKRRAKYTGSLYDRFRIDHLVGFYRTYSRMRDKKRDARGKLAAGAFAPEIEAEQLSHGERVVSAMIEGATASGSRLVAEDLGSVPPFVRASIARLGVPGYKVLIWEKDGEVFREPATYPELSVACFGTHDTDPVAAWWEKLTQSERAAMLRLPSLRPYAGELGPVYSSAVHRALVDLIASARSELVLLLVQDVLGTHERINTPATIGPHNWTYRLPGTPSELAADEEIRRRVSTVIGALRSNGRA